MGIRDEHSYGNRGFFLWQNKSSREEINCMDHEFDRKPDDSQDKHEQAKTSFEDLQKLMEQFKITADEAKAEQKPNG